MSCKRNSSNSSLIDDSSDNTENSVLAKLRRLKIEENLLINNINKINLKETEGSNSELPMLYSLELKNYTGKLKNKLTDIKNMFGELKAMAEEKLSSVDIDNMKRDVVKLDEKIRLIKSYVHTELALETSKEKELIKQMNDVDERQSKCTPRPKIKIKPFNNIVPSPVKVLIQSPFKCKEVQNFQAFMMNSPNRYGGWNEYHHNVFIQTWQKHFKCIDETALNDGEDFMCHNKYQFQAFQSEILEKITGSTKDDIISHYKWYCKYLYLKEQQQNALNKWRRNKGMLTKSYNKYGKMNQKSNINTSKQFDCKEESRSIQNVEELLGTIETCDAEEIANALCDMAGEEGSSLEADINLSNIDSSEDAPKPKQRTSNDILRPTQQWTNRCNSSNEDVKGYNDVEMIKKFALCDMAGEEGSSLEADINLSNIDSSEDAPKPKQRTSNDILRPTQQWTNRCNSSNEDVKRYNDVEMIKKLRIPDWRMPLQD